MEKSSNIEIDINDINAKSGKDFKNGENGIKGWNEPLEQVVKNIGESAQAYKFMHYYTAKKFNTLYHAFMYLNLILSPIAGTIAAVESILNPSTSYLSIPIAILSYISTIITAIIKFSKFNEKSDQHKLTSTKYSSIEQNIRNQLGLYRDDRPNAKLYYEWINRAYDDLFKSAPLLSNTVYRDYHKKNKSGIISLKSYDPFITVEKGYKEKIVEGMNNKEKISVNLELKDTVIQMNNDTESEAEPRRIDTYSPIADYNQYNEAQMKYEMARFIGF